MTRNVICNLWPGGRTRALTLSYDDGTLHDRRLVEILNQHGIRATFHLNSGRLGLEKHLTRAEVPALFAGHEISAHSVTHPFLEVLPPTQVAAEIIEDHRALEELAGYPVRGLSYPCGTHGTALRAQLPALGIEYARTVHSTEKFDVPDDFLMWDPTCHHKNPRLMELLDRFLAEGKRWRYQLFYLWGHSYEFANDNNWGLIEEFCRKAGRRDDVWYATNIEVADYLRACRSLVFAVAGQAVHNPSGMDISVQVDGAAVVVPAGKTIKLSQ